MGEAARAGLDVPSRLVLATCGVAALLGVAGDAATDGWSLWLATLAAAVVVAAAARRRGDPARSALALAGLAVAVTFVLFVPALVLVALVGAPFDDTASDPWYDYLALPVAPLLLGVQVAALFVRTQPLRWALLVGPALAIGAMFAYVATLDLDASEGANIGAGILFLWVVLAVLLVVAGTLRDAVRRSASRESAR